MSDDIFKGKWKELKGKIKEEWADLTDQDMERIEGKKDEFLGVLQQKYGYTKDQAKLKLDTFLKKHQSNKDSPRRS